MLGTLVDSLLIAALLVLRRIFQGRVHPTWQYAVWIVVAIGLLMPLHISSPASIMNLVQPPSVPIFETQILELPASSPSIFKSLEYGHTLLTLFSTYHTKAAVFIRLPPWQPDKAALKPELT